MTESYLSVLHTTCSAIASAVGFPGVGCACRFFEIDFIAWKLLARRVLKVPFETTNQHFSTGQTARPAARPGIRKVMSKLIHHVLTVYRSYGKSSAVSKMFNRHGGHGDRNTRAPALEFSNLLGIICEQLSVCQEDGWCSQTRRQGCKSHIARRFSSRKIKVNVMSVPIPAALISDEDSTGWLSDI